MIDTRSADHFLLDGHDLEFDNDVRIMFWKREGGWLRRIRRSANPLSSANTRLDDRNFPFQTLKIRNVSGVVMGS
jgi:hypothetical protein